MVLKCLHTEIFWTLFFLFGWGRGDMKKFITNLIKRIMGFLWDFSWKKRNAAYATIMMQLQNLEKANSDSLEWTSVCV